MKRIYFPIGGFLLGIGTVAMGTLVPWIPEWFGFQLALCLLGWVGALVAGVLIVRGAWLQSNGRMEIGFRWVITVMPALLLAGIIGFGTLMSLFVISGGLFPPALRSKIEVPGKNATVYLFDTGFLDAQTTITLRQGFLPVMKQVAVVPYFFNENIAPTVSGDWVEFDGAYLNLENGEFREH